ncbi:MAG TPA: glycosyltransferase family 1 protein [Azospirillum sp.]|nr:glycosyltransferase family 1 protein [Azospirillum sp.]
MKYTESEDVAVGGAVRAFDVLGAPRRPSDFVCFSHLRWGFVHQRPQHLMTRFAREFRLFYVEEPVPTDAAAPSIDTYGTDVGVTLVVPRVPQGMDAESAQRGLLERFFAERGIDRPILWYYTPMSLAFTDHLPASAVVYDCMDELSAFRGAPPELIDRERALMRRADLVFTGGVSLYEAKRDLHGSVHAFPSSVDVAHFAQARGAAEEPEDQAGLPRPRLGFFGVIDERFDIDLLAAVAALRPQWQFVMLGPVVKIDPATLPQASNIHYPGMRGYADLPRYLSGWDVAVMPFAMNESTRFISPTKTPEFLASGRPVVSTPVRDVVRTYGNTGLVHIAATPNEFVAACEKALAVDRTSPEWLGRVDGVLRDMSWDSTWGRMKGLIECVI